MKKKDLCTRVARWTLLLSEFDCEVHHRAGTKMRHVDALSRYPSAFVVEMGLLNQIRSAEKQDNECKLIIEV